MKDKIPAIRACFHPSRIGNSKVSISLFIEMIVNHHITDTAIIFFFLADAHHNTIHTIVKDPLGDIKCQFLLTDIIQ